VRVLSIVHEREAGSGIFANVAARRGDELIEWIPAERAPPAIASVGAALVFGGAMNVDEEDHYDWLRGEKEVIAALLGQGAPILGVCLGAQLLAEVAGGGATPATSPEIGWTEVELERRATDDPLLGPLPARFESFQWHSYELSAPPGALTLARSRSCLQAFRLRSGRAWGVQFHAEVTESTIADWVADYRSDPDAVRAELDWPALLDDTRREMGCWNALGAGICDRFLDHAAGLS
jgi:GMP synthase-like glutamine amidotransferase